MLDRPLWVAPLIALIKKGSHFFIFNQYVYESTAFLSIFDIYKQSLLWFIKELQRLENISLQGLQIHDNLTSS